MRLPLMSILAAIVLLGLLMVTPTTAALVVKWNSTSGDGTDLSGTTVLPGTYAANWSGTGYYRYFVSVYNPSGAEVSNATVVNAGINTYTLSTTGDWTVYFGNTTTTTTDSSTITIEPAHGYVDLSKMGATLSDVGGQLFPGITAIVVGAIPILIVISLVIFLITFMDKILLMIEKVL